MGKGWIALPHDVVQPVYGLVAHHGLHLAPVLLALGMLDLLGEGLCKVGSTYSIQVSGTRTGT